jgi:hypothetical protein
MIKVFLLACFVAFVFAQAEVAAEVEAGVEGFDLSVHQGNVSQESYNCLARTYKFAVLHGYRSNGQVNISRRTLVFKFGRRSISSSREVAKHSIEFGWISKVQIIGELVHKIKCSLKLQVKKSSNRDTSWESTLVQVNGHRSCVDIKDSNNIQCGMRITMERRISVLLDHMVVGLSLGIHQLQSNTQEQLPLVELPSTRTGHQRFQNKISLLS